MIDTLNGVKAKYNWGAPHWSNHSYSHWMGYCNLMQLLLSECVMKILLPFSFLIKKTPTLTARTISGVSKIEPPLPRFSISFPPYFPWFSNIFRDISPLFLEKFHQKMIFPMIFQYFPMIFPDISIILSPSAPRQVAGAGFEAKSSVEIAWVQPLQLERAGMVQLKPPRCPARKSWYTVQSRSIFIFLIHIFMCVYI